MVHLQDILDEWSMKSHDGLTSGHEDPQNIQVLKEVLRTNGFTAEQIDEVVEALGQPKPKVKPMSSTSPIVDKDKPLQLSSKSMIEDKKLKNFGDKLFRIAVKNPEFAKLYDTMTVEEAIDFVNGKSPLYKPEYASIIQKFDEGRSSTVGRGEHILVYLVRGGESGGTKSGDLSVPHLGLNIDVKELDPSSNTFRTEVASFHNFGSTDFAMAINELIYFAASDPQHVKIFKQIINDSDATDREKKYTMKFFDELDIERLTYSTCIGLTIIGQKLLKSTESDVPVDHAEFSIEDEKTTVSIDNSKEIKNAVRQQGDINNAKSEPSSVVVKMSPVSDRDTQLIIPRMKKLKYFTKKFTYESIAKNIIPKLHYDAIAFFKNGSFPYYMDKPEMAKRFKFYGWSKAPSFKLKDSE